MWEALAILVAVRRWAKVIGRNAIVGVRSDSLGSLLAMRKQASRSSGIAIILRELALDESELDANQVQLTHIPGVTNVWPDALSRLWAPEPKVIPPELAGAVRSTVPLRDKDFWRSCRDPSK